jgi:choice-of-anchor B domain-containing protein
MTRPATPLLLLGLLALTAPLHAQSGSFGNAVLLGDGELLISEPTTNFRPGSVRLFESHAGEWHESARLQAPDARRADGFGTVLARAGNTLFVGQRAGPIHTFERDGSEWRHSGTVPGSEALGIQAPEDGADDPLAIPLGCNQYGYCDTDFRIAIAAEGDWLLVGDPDGQGGGSVHAYRRTAGGDWEPSVVLQPGDAAPDQEFGAAIALEGGRALIGAPARAVEDDGTVEGAGRVYEFVLEGEEWREVGPLDARPERDAHFGAAIALDGDRAVIGAPGSADGHGAAYLYDRDPTSEVWIERSRLAAFSGARGDYFGASVTFSGADVWVGAPTNRGIESGRVYVFRSDPEADLLSASDRIALDETVAEDEFGGRVFGGDGLVAVSALGMHHGAGSVHLFDRGSDGAWMEGPMLVSEPDALAPLVGEERECEDGMIGPFECDEVDLVAFLPNSMLAPPGRERGVRLNDNWGWTDHETGREYALVGRNDGLAFVDITDPTNPVLVGDLPATPDTPRSQLWRDPKVYEDHVFVVADGAGNHGLQIFDLTRLRDVTTPPVTFEPDVHYDRVASVHNININEETGFAAMVSARGGGETCGGGMHMLDVSDPKNPVFLGCQFDETGTHDVQCATYRGPDERYQGREICLKANGQFLSISDVTDRDNPEVVSRGYYPNPGYLHQGWLTEDHRYFIMDDEADVIRGHVETTRTIIFDVSDVEDPVLAKEFMGSFPASAHNQYVRGNFTYQANYRYGLHILDITDPEDPSEVGYFVTTPYLTGPGFSGAWSTFPYFEDPSLILVTSVQDGMFILRQRDPAVVF